MPKFFGQVGAGDYITNGGMFLFQDDSGEYFAELLEVGRINTIYVFEIPVGLCDWFDWRIDEIIGASSQDISRIELIHMFSSDNPIERAHAYWAVAECFGANKLDDTPMHVYDKEVIRLRYSGPRSPLGY